MIQPAGDVLKLVGFQLFRPFGQDEVAAVRASDLPGVFERFELLACGKGGKSTLLTGAVSMVRNPTLQLRDLMERGPDLAALDVPPGSGYVTLSKAEVGSWAREQLMVEGLALLTAFAKESGPALKARTAPIVVDAMKLVNWWETGGSTASLADILPSDQEQRVQRLESGRLVLPPLEEGHARAVLRGLLRGLVASDTTLASQILRPSFRLSSHQLGVVRVAADRILHGEWEPSGKES